MVVSFGVQFLIVAVLILIPLIYTDVLPQAQLTSMLTRRRRLLLRRRRRRLPLP